MKVNWINYDAIKKRLNAWNAPKGMGLLFASTVILDGSISYTLDSFISTGVTGGL